MAKKKMKVEEIIEFLKKEEENSTIEGQLLHKKLIRELYKQLGDPKREDFPEEFETADVCGWSKTPGYTTWINIRTARMMEIDNNAPTIWRINRSSMTKVNIAEKYTRAGWHCEVQSYNVLCGKYVKHPRYKNLWVHFYSSRDCSRYSYVIERGEE